MASNMVAGFLKGVAGYGLQKMEENEREEREMRKIKMLEQLRKDTEKEMALFRDELNKRKPDPRMSTDDFSTGKRTLRNEYGEDIGAIDLPASAVEDRNMDKQYKQAQLDNFAADNARADRQLAISEGHLGLARQNAARSLDGSGGSGGGKDGVLLAEANKIFQTMKDSGAPGNWVAQAQAKWYDGVNNKKWSKEQQRVFLSQMMESWASVASKQSGIMAKVDSKEDDED